MKKILIVEDDKYTEKVYEVKFKKEGYDVRIVSNGQELISKLQQFHPDLIILDLIMPVKDGFQALAEVKNNPDWRKIPILVVTNLSQPDDIEKVRELGAVDVLTKTDATLEELEAKVRSLIGASA